MRHPLRHQVVEARHQLPRRVDGHPARGRGALGPHAIAYSYGGYTTNLPIEDLTDGKAWVVTEHESEPLRASTVARAAAGPPPVLLEERQVGRGRPGDGPRRARLLGGERLPQPRPVAGRALLDRLTPVEQRAPGRWQIGTVKSIRAETRG